MAYAIGSADMSRYGPWFDNKTSSVRNNTRSWWCQFEKAQYKGAVVTVAPGDTSRA